MIYVLFGSVLLLDVGLMTSTFGDYLCDDVDVFMFSLVFIE